MNYYRVIWYLLHTYVNFIPAIHLTFDLIIYIHKRMVGIKIISKVYSIRCIFNVFLFWHQTKILLHKTMHDNKRNSNYTYFNHCKCLSVSGNIILQQLMSERALIAQKSAMSNKTNDGTKHDKSTKQLYIIIFSWLV